MIKARGNEKRLVGRLRRDLRMRLTKRHSILITGESAGIPLNVIGKFTGQQDP